MSRGKQDAVVVVWDLGLPSLQLLPGGRTFLEQSRRCVHKIIGNKLLVQPKDLVGLVTFGTEETQHALEKDGFDNIITKFELQVASFAMLEYVEAATHTHVQGDWMGALCVALHMLKTRDKLNKKTVVFVSPLSLCVDARELKTIIKGSLAVGCTFIFIGNEESSEEGSGTMEGDVPISAAIAHMSDRGVPVVRWGFPQAMQSLTNGYTSKMVTPRPWKVELEIGNVLKIKVCGFNEISTETKPKFQQLTARDMEKGVQREMSYFEKGNKRRLIDPEEVIQGHKFGTSIVPFSKEDQVSLKYQSGPECLKVLGFVDKRKVPPPMFTNVGIQTFFADDTDPVAVVSFSALVRALHTDNKAALVRKVSRNNGRLIFGTLLPQLRAEGERLVLVELPFAEDLRRYGFRKFRVEPTQKQLDAVDQLIDSMDLMTAGDNGGEVFENRDTSDPMLVYQNELLLFRALHPDQEVPPPSETILHLLQPPNSVRLAQEQMEAVFASAFPTLAKTRKQLARPGTSITKKKSESSDNVCDMVATQPLVPLSTVVSSVKQCVVCVGTISPAEDFQQLLHQGRDLVEVFQQSESVVLKLAMHAQTSDDIIKPTCLVRAMRQVCVRQDPGMYNTWIRELRALLLERGKPLLWCAIQTEKLGLICDDENSVSDVTRHEASEFLQGGDADTSHTMDTDDMFGEVE